MSARLFVSLGINEGLKSKVICLDISSIESYRMYNMPEAKTSCTLVRTKTGKEYIVEMNFFKLEELLEDSIIVINPNAK